MRTNLTLFSFIVVEILFLRYLNSYNSFEFDKLDFFSSKKYMNKKIKINSFM